MRHPQLGMGMPWHNLLYVAGMLVLVRPLLARFAAWQDKRPSLTLGVFTLVCVLHWRG